MDEPAPEKFVEPATRIFGVVARAAPYVLLIRRGPSKRVLTIGWDTAKHEFRSGQWLKGRIYEERCDLSPSGEKFVYLAANHRFDGLGSWTAVSRAPFLKALLLWDNLGTWGGGGLFESERVLALNKMGPVQPLNDLPIPKGLTVKPIAPWAGRGEDDPIRMVRMKRDGWSLEAAGVHGKYRRYENGHRFHWEYESPEIWHRPRNGWILERREIAMGEIAGPWRVREHRLLDAARTLVLDFGRSDWADWSFGDELLLARDGKVHRLSFSTKSGPGELEELMDLGPLKFEAVPAPPEAATWYQRVEGKRIK
jgi:hypothetical protein